MEQNVEYGVFVKSVSFDEVYDYLLFVSDDIGECDEWAMNENIDDYEIRRTNE